MQAPRTVLFTLLIFCGTLLAQTNPIPFVNQPLVPESAAPGGTGFTLTVNGTGFVSGAVVKWNGTTRSTTFVNSSKLRATISAADIATPLTASITVSNPTPGGGTSNSARFTVRAPSPSVQLFNKHWGVTKHDGILSVVAADFDLDGSQDLAVYGQSYNSKPSRIFILRGDGQGNFTKTGSFAIEGALGSFNGPLIAADFNGDGKPDLSVISALNQVSVLLGNGDGTFQAPKTFLTGVSPFGIAAADFNQDGKLDIVVSNVEDNTVSVLLGNGDGTFSRIDSPTGGGDPGRLAVGDFDQDGILDLAVAEGSGEVTILLGVGNGEFVYGGELFTSNFTSSVSAADLNGDGKLDLLVDILGSPRSFQWIFLGNGDGSFQKAGKVAVSNSEVNSEVADMNGDNIPDIIVATSSGGRGPVSIEIWLGDGSGGFQKAGRSDAGAECCIVQIPLLADFNGDGMLDMAMPKLSPGQALTVFQSSVSLSPRSLGFGAQQVGKRSKPLSSILTNGGTSSLTISSFSFNGQGDADFSESNDCPTTLAPGASCTIQVTFKPAFDGPRKANLRIADDGPEKKESLPVQGKGIN